MRQHYILCALTALSQYNPQDPKENVRPRELYKNKQIGYKFSDYEQRKKEDATFTYTPYLGIQTNEAPIKCLIDIGKRNGDPVTGILYLCSDACTWLNVIMHEGEQPITTEQYFQDVIREYYASIDPSWIEPKEFFKHVRYDTDDPARYLQEIIDKIGNDAIVDLETTGGLRDAVTLVTLSVQIIKMKSVDASGRTNPEPNVSLGTTVYANYGSHFISRQDTTYNLIDLVNAADAFTRYGKADALVSFFDDELLRNRCSLALKGLCEELKLFSSSLSICRTRNITSTVQNVHRYLEELDPRAITNDDVRIPRAELLFRELVPTIKKGFVQPVSTPGYKEELLVPGIIRWCLDRSMYQQALALFEGKIPRYLAAAGILPCKVSDADSFIHAIYPSSFRGNQRKKWFDADKVDQIVHEWNDYIKKSRLSRMQKIDWDEHLLPSLLLATFPELMLKASVPKPMAMGLGNAKPALARILIWYNYICAIRNTVMHPDAQGSIPIRIYQALAFFNWKLPPQFECYALKQNGRQDTTRFTKALIADMNAALNLIESYNTDNWRYPKHLLVFAQHMHSVGTSHKTT